MSRQAVVIGGGAAGLAAGRELTRIGCDVNVLERGSSVGTSWRGRYARLRLNTVRWMSGLPGAPLPRSVGRWVSRDDYVSYLERYADAAGLDVRTSTKARRVDWQGGRWIVRTDAEDLTADLVVVATGYDHTPRLPTWRGADGFEGELLHASAYVDSQPYVGRDVLVVGTGSTGLEIATDLAEGGGRRVRVAQRTPPNFTSREWSGVPLTPLALIDRVAPAAVTDVVGRALQGVQHRDLAALGMPRAPVGMGTQLRRDGRGPVIVDGFVEALRNGRIEIVGAVEAFDGRHVLLTGGQAIRPDVVLAATGYERGLDELVGHLDVLDGHGLPSTTHGRPDPSRPGLFFIGYTVPLSGQLFEIARDARRIARSTQRSRVRIAGQTSGDRSVRVRTDRQPHTSAPTKRKRSTKTTAMTAPSRKVHAWCGS